MDIVKQVFLKSIVVIIPAALLAAYFIEPRKVPLGIVLGWLFGVVNLRQLTRNIQGMVGTERMTLKVVILSMTRLLALSAAIFFLIYYAVVNVFGLLFGFTVVFVFILVAGLKIGRKETQ